MPTQTTVKDYIAIPDGCKVEVDDGSGYADLGATMSDVTNTLEYDVNKVESANAAVLIKSTRNPRITGAFELGNLNPELIEQLGGGMFERVSTTGAVAAEDQVQATPAVEVLVHMILLDSGGTNLRPSATVTVTSVTAASSGVLTVNTDYDIIADDTSPSGYSIRYETGAVTGAEAVTIVYPSQTMVSSQVLYMGSSTVELTAYKLRFTHTDDNSLVRKLELFSVNTSSGGFSFNFKGATSDGIETMALSYEATIDSSLTDGRQLAAWTYDAGAE